jgi:hypothetical protein
VVLRSWRAIIERRERGRGLGPTIPNTECAGLVSGVPRQTKVQGGRRRCLGAGKMIVVGVGVCIRARTMGRRPKTPKIETETLWLSFGLDPGFK